MFGWREGYTLLLITFGALGVKFDLVIPRSMGGGN